jgi:serine/threonine protein phosphatase 1
MIPLTPAPSRLPPGERVYAVGDVHGCSDRLAHMHWQIAADLAARPVAQATVVHLGDYVDRGEDSRGVVHTLARPWTAPAPGVAPPRLVNLMGNHEEMMLSALGSGGAAAAELWLVNGGAATLESWGVPQRTRPRDWPSYFATEELLFLSELPLSHTAGGYIFVHAGLRPELPLQRQSRADMLWIREPFLSWEGDLPGVVVHGHTPARDVVVRHNRIGVDTGAVMGGMLTCVVLEGETMGLLRA